MIDQSSDKIAASFPDLEPIIVSTPATRGKKKNTYREIRQQLASVEYSNLEREYDELRSKVKELMDEEAKFQDRIKRNISFWKLEHPYLKTEIRRLKAKSNQLQIEIRKLQTKVPIGF